MQYVLSILQVALGLGFVIFIHELGHFLVAKACGVRCDKFFVGFDIGGLKISRQWGETEYGIGILPLGGYVKMFGQDDNVANAAEEMAASKAMEGSPDAKEIVGMNGEKTWVHKRSYLAKNVPQRMAIISAGVIMNVISAVFMAWFALGLGVPEIPAVVGGTVSGGAAWEAGLRSGDRLAKINETDDPTFRQLTQAVVLGDLESGVEFQVERVGGSTETISIRPKKEDLAPQIGVVSASRLRLPKQDALRPNTPSAEAGDSGFRGGDQIVAIDGEPVSTWADYLGAVIPGKDRSIEFTVIRGGKAPASDPFAPVTGGEKVSFTIAPNPRERLGIIPTLGPVTALVKGGPAETAGLKVGDRLVAMDAIAIAPAPDGEEGIDPVKLADRLAVAAGSNAAVTLTVAREGTAEPVEVSLTPEIVTWISSPRGGSSPLSLDAIGAAFELRAEIAAVVTGSPADKAGLGPGIRIVSAELRSENKEDTRSLKPTEFGKGKRNWPALLINIQDNSPDFEVVLKVNGGEGSEAATREVVLKPVSVDGEFEWGRGIRLEPHKRLVVVTDPNERIRRSFSEVGDQLGGVLRFLQKIGGQVSVKALGGPITIAAGAGQAAFEGFGALLMFLVMLSANLAVLNLLPIPVLDGGHLVFLAYEGITGKPVNERVMVALQTVGLIMLLGLMLFVTTMDIGRLWTMVTSWLF